jgi:hypothetical protein
MLVDAFMSLKHVTWPQQPVHSESHSKRVLSVSNPEIMQVSHVMTAVEISNNNSYDLHIEQMFACK